ncbi:MAG: xylan 1,4-beta-xylosidase [Lachnospiraceae bacterium]|nr:xylan 1,4-beta-xylosidase [Lachnospiraceae bacterium]
MKITVQKDAQVPFYNNVDFCVGTGRLGLALTKEYLEELRFVQEHIGFSHIRGHGLLSDDVGIYHEYEENGETKVEYNYTYLDRIFDAYLDLGIRPFLELGFMPGDLASGTQTIFYWKGNTTPPKDYGKWTDLVTALLRHLLERYGQEVYDWPIEVWNEPNLPGFWYQADMEEYFRLFGETFRAIKALDGRFQVGGPAICGVRDEEWIRSFLEFCRKEGIRPDSVTRHHYTVEFPEHAGHYDYHRLEDSDMRIANLQSTRDIIDSFPEFRGLPIHITEFSTSYTPKGVIHDTNLNAAYLAGQLSRLGEMNESYSYWTFGDVFEEQGIPFTPFHGGFGLVAAGCIPKPTFWTFAFYKELKKKSLGCVSREQNAVIVRTKDGYAGILWNASEEDLPMELSLEMEAQEAVLVTKTVDETCCNPLKLWHDLGEHANPAREETALLREAAHPFVESAVQKTVSGAAQLSLCIRRHGVIFFTLEGRTCKPDRGYDYERVLSFH